MALLRIVRDSGYEDRVRAYKVIVDGKTAGEIRNGETKEFPVSSGQHEVSLKIDWCRSRVLPFTVAEGDSVTFDVQSSIRGRKVLAALWYTLFKRNSYILIEQR